MARLIETPMRQRVVEARLSGGFRWAPMLRATRGERESGAGDIVAAADEVFREANLQHSPYARHAVALARLVTNRSSEAVSALAPLAVSAGDAMIWNDLAAAHFTSAVSTSRPEELVGALAAVDAACRLRPDLPEARFNRALIIEHLGIREPAIAAWQRFLELDGGSEWALEARVHLQTLKVVEPVFGDVFDRDHDRITAHPEEARILVRQFPQEARSAGESEILGKWAEAHVKNDSIAAAQQLAVAREIGDELVRTRGEQMLSRAIATIERSDEAERKVLAGGHLDYRLALRTFKEGRPGEAERLARRAATAFSTGGSPMTLLARFFAAYMAYEGGRANDSAREFETLLPSVPPEYAACRGKIQWELGIVRGAQARWGDCIELAEAALKVFDRLGEKDYAAMIRELLAQAYDIVGDPATAWSYRTEALPRFGRKSTPFLQAGVLGFLSQEATFRHDWLKASSFTELEIEVAKTAHYDPDLADAHLRRALIRKNIGGGNPAEDLALARTLIAAIPDVGMRSRLEARRVAAEAMVASTPSEAVPLFTTAIAFHQGVGGQRMFLPTLLLHRARAYRAVGRAIDARHDIDGAIAELDAGRDSLRSAEQRSGMFESADTIFDEAIDLALEQRDVEGAFGYAEHARARALLDTMRSTEPLAKPAELPERTSIVEYVALPKRLVVFVVDRGGIRVVSRPVLREDITERAAALTDALSRNSSNARGLERSLYDDLFAPVHEWIASNETIVVVADANISTLPFAALVAPDGRFLIEKHAVVAAPSAAVFMRASAERQGDVRGLRLLVVVNGAARGGLQALPSAEQEARRVQAAYHDTQVLRGEEATRRAFVREAPYANVIHFAGHALSSEYRPDDTSIVLTGADGIMTVKDIARLRLRGSSTVVLAACSTARGKVRRFEGTLSVARAFIASGAPSVIATLWPIDDLDAAQFFPGLHGYLARGLSAPEALRAAQLDSIRRSDSPAMWAAVQAIGS